MAGRKTPVTETKTVSEARRTFSETLNRVYRGETRVVIEKNGIPVGAVVSAADMDALQRLDEERRLKLEAFAEARKAFEGIPSEEIEREIERAIAEVEEERRKTRVTSEKQSA